MLCQVKTKAKPMRYMEINKHIYLRAMRKLKHIYHNIYGHIK